MTTEFYKDLGDEERVAALGLLRAFVEEEVMPLMRVHFSDFNILVDDLSAHQSFTFVNMTRGNRKAIIWGFLERDRFSASVGEVIRNRRKNVQDFEVAGKRYLVVNMRAVWYESQKRDTVFGSDHTKRGELLHLAIKEISGYLEEENKNS